MRTQPQPAASDDSRLFRRVKLGILLMLAIFMIEIFTFLPQYWPLTRWRMYSGGRELSSVAETVLVRVTAAHGETIDLFPPALGFAAGKIIDRAFKENPVSEAYQALLIERVHAALPDLEIVSIAAWRNHYDVAYTALPPIDLQKPDDAEFLGMIDLTEAA